MQQEDVMMVYELRLLLHEHYKQQLLVVVELGVGAHGWWAGGLPGAMGSQA